MQAGKRTRRMTRSFRSRVGKVLMQKAETKYYDRGVEDVQLYHNLGRGAGPLAPTGVTSIPQLFNLWTDINQGSARFNRIGDDLYPRGMKIRMYLANKSDRPCTKIRIIVAVLPKVFGGTVTDFAFDPFQITNSGAVGNTLLYPPDKDKGVKFLYDRIHRLPNDANIGNGQVNKEPTKYVNIWVRPKKGSKIRYDTTSSTIVNKPIAVYAIPYEQYSTLTTDNVASCAAFARLYYKDV